MANRRAGDLHGILIAWALTIMMLAFGIVILLFSIIAPAIRYGIQI